MTACLTLVTIGDTDSDILSTRSNLLPTSTLRGKYHHFSHFTERKSEAQRGQSTESQEVAKSKFRPRWVLPGPSPLCPSSLSMMAEPCPSACSSVSTHSTRHHWSLSFPWPWHTAYPQGGLPPEGSCSLYGNSDFTRQRSFLFNSLPPSCDLALPDDREYPCPESTHLAQKRFLVW